MVLDTLGAKAMIAISTSTPQQDVRGKTAESEMEHVPVKLTTGIEMEVLCVVDKSMHKIKHADGINIVRDVLSKPLSATCKTCKMMHDFLLPLENALSEVPRSYQGWNVVSDDSVDLRDDEWDALGVDRMARMARMDLFSDFSIEVKSRVLHLSSDLQTTTSDQDPSHIHSIDFREEISAVINALYEAFNGPDPKHKGMHLVVNDSCGLHVHVGNGRCGFPLRTIKNLLSVVLAKERTIDSLHAVSRIGGSPLALEAPKDYANVEITKQIEPEVFNLPLSFWMAQTTYKLNAHETGAYEAQLYPRAVQYPETHYLQDDEVKRAALSFVSSASVNLVNRAPNLEALKDLTGSFTLDPPSTVNLSNLGEYDPSGIREKDTLMTIEFRQHAGSLQISEILAWVDVVVSLIQYAHEASPADVKDICDESRFSDDRETFAFLEDIDCLLRTIAFYRHKQDRSNVEKLPPDDKIRPLMEKLVDKRYEDSSPRDVRYRIDQKLKCGGYGKVTSESLRTVSFTDEEMEAGLREKLTIESFEK